jgi:hypothetical protein
MDPLESFTGGSSAEGYLRLNPVVVCSLHTAWSAHLSATESVLAGDGELSTRRCVRELTPILIGASLTKLSWIEVVLLDSIISE